MPLYAQDRPNMRERLTILRNDPPVLSVVSITRVGSISTVTTSVAHQLASTDYATIAGAVESAFNNKFKVTVTSPTTFTFVGGSGSSATGTITAVYTSSASGGQGAEFWRSLATIRAERIPLKAYERLQLSAVQSDTTYRFRTRARADLNESMRMLWTPSWPVASSQQTLEINGLLPDPDSIAYQFIEASRSPAA